MFLRFFFTQATDAGILSDEIQRFLRIARGVKLIKSSSDDEIETLSDRLESYLIDTATFMKRVVSNTFSSSIIALSSLPPPFPCKCVRLQRAWFSAILVINVDLAICS